MYWRIRDTSLKTHPLSKHQHAFQKGKSTETAVSTLIDSLQHSVYRGGSAIAVSLDVRGAFDHVIYDSAERVMKAHDFDPKITAWYIRFLKTKSVLSQ